MYDIAAILALSPVIPVLVVQDPFRAIPMGNALVKGGLRAIEVTLRTDAALEVIAEMAGIAGAVVGAGTVLNEYQLDQAIAAGAKFIVSPGLTEKLGHAAIERNIPYLPGVANAADIMVGLDLGLDRFKFFPAAAAGGIAALKALAAPFYQCEFCPTGGISLDTAPDWLAIEQVACVGGSWIIPADNDPAEIEHRARAAAALAISDATQA